MIRHLCVFAILLCAAAPAQDSPFVAPDVYRYLSGEISGDNAYDHIRHLTLYQSNTAASDGYRDKIRWIAEKAKQNGLADVRIIQDLPSDEGGWTARAADLFEVEPRYQRLASLEAAAVMLADNSAGGDWTGALIDVGEGLTDKDYEGREVKGAIVLASGSIGGVVREAVRKRGALGVVRYDARNLDDPDQIPWLHMPRPKKDDAAAFGFSLSNRAGTELKRRLARGEKITLRATVAADFEDNATQWMVEGFIRGKQRGQAIMLTAHVQEEKYSANDDNSGCASLLEICRSMAKLIREGKLPQPERDIRFWWANEISGEYAYFAKHPEERSQILLDINQDMVGAKQSDGSRIQHITMAPWSRPSFLNDAIESVATMVMRGNTAYLAASQAAGASTPYSKPILSTRGTRERYGAEFVPYFSNTDHMVFVDSVIGIPATTLTNWPDPYIHSSSDDLWNVDPTQIQRNAFVVAATAWYFAALQPGGVPALAAQVHAGALRRLAKDFARASELIACAPKDQRAGAYLEAANLIDRAAERETGALRSVLVFDRSLKLPSLDPATAGHRKALAANYTLIAGEEPPAAPALTNDEKKMAAKVPEVALGVAEYIEKRGWDEGGPGLHGLMAFEALNFVDGTRSYLDIYRAVRAEAQAAGEWYYGTVSASAVAAALDAAVNKGLIRLRADVKSQKR